jgi:hypothetical protein
LKIYLIKKIYKFVLLFVTFQIFAIPYPPVSSTYQLRITNRRFISHLLFENINNQFFLTIILTHGPNYHAYKSTSYRLYYECSNPKKCLEEAIKIDEFLKTGYNIAFVINGDYIEKIIYLKEKNE